MPKMRPKKRVQEVLENGKVTGYKAGKNGFNYQIKNGDSAAAKAKAEAQLRKMIQDGDDEE